MASKPALGDLSTLPLLSPVGEACVPCFGDWSHCTKDIESLEALDLALLTVDWGVVAVATVNHVERWRGGQHRHWTQV